MLLDIHKDNLEKSNKWIFDFGMTGGMYLSPSEIVPDAKNYIKSWHISSTKSLLLELKKEIEGKRFPCICSKHQVCTSDCELCSPSMIREEVISDISSLLSRIIEDI